MKSNYCVKFNYTKKTVFIYFCIIFLSCNFLGGFSYLQPPSNTTQPRAIDKRLIGRWINVTTFLNDTANSMTFLFDFNDNRSYYRAAYYHILTKDSFTYEYSLSSYGSWDTSQFRKIIIYPAFPLQKALKRA
jgi:hypothetical protein